MAFVNEIITEQDKEWLSKIITLENIKRTFYDYTTTHQYSGPDYVNFRLGAVDRDRNAYYIPLGGMDAPEEGRYPNAALVLDGSLIMLCPLSRGKGDHSTGIHSKWYVHNLAIPKQMEHRREEIKQLNREAIEEEAHCSPFADGGTIANSNMKARRNIVSFELEFK